MSNIVIMSDIIPQKTAKNGVFMSDIAIMPDIIHRKSVIFARIKKQRSRERNAVYWLIF